jgi:hypothetical protein
MTLPEFLSYIREGHAKFYRYTQSLISLVCGSFACVNIVKYNLAC